MIGIGSAGSVRLPGANRWRRRIPLVGLATDDAEALPPVLVVAQQRLARVPTGGQPSPQRKRRWWLIVVLLLINIVAATALFTYLVWQRSAPQPIVEGQPFHPTASRWVRGGSYRVASIDIPAGVTVTAAGDLELMVSGDTHIAGRLTGECAAISIQGDGAVVVTGSVDNACPAESTGVKDLMIYSHDGAMQFGGPEAPARLHTSGVLDVTNADLAAAWQFDLLPATHSTASLPPVCRVEANTVNGVASAPDLPAPDARVAFSGWGVDPDGGAVTYAWDFGDSRMPSAPHRAAPEHAYTAPGVYDVVLEVTDDEGEICQATARIVVGDGGNGEAAAATPGVWAAPARLVVPATSEVSFSAQALAPDGSPIVHRWDFGDGGVADGAQPGHRYEAPGRYEVTLTASLADQPSISSTAVASIYVFDAQRAASESGTDASIPAAEHRVEWTAAAIRFRYDGAAVFLPSSRWVTTGAQPRPDQTQSISAGDIELYVTGDLTFAATDGDNLNTLLASAGTAGANSSDPGLRRDGGNGGAVIVIAGGDMVLGAGTMIGTGDGGTGGTLPTGETVIGGNGGQGGDLVLETGEHLTIEGGATLSSGSGGTGGTAIASATSGPAVLAHGGSGGSAGRLQIDGAYGLNFAPAAESGVTVRAGRGGAGGAATANGVSGASGCPGGRDGTTAVAIGGHGGNGAAGWAPALTGCEIAVAVWGGDGGPGGSATATAGDGGNAGSGGAPCTSAANGGTGGQATAIGGQGGTTGVLDLSACRERLAPDDAGSGSLFRDGPGGDAMAAGGMGGQAAAIGPACGESARASGGAGGAAHASGGAGWRGGNAGAYPGSGGIADARGGDCRPLCGRPGGSAWARGGDGGQGIARGGSAMDDPAKGARDYRALAGLAGVVLDAAEGSETGQGGDAAAQGGAGGDCAANECPAGRGGKGGSATAIAGVGGELSDTSRRWTAPDGDATASGGTGGRGADCCAGPPLAGGNGAPGGSAEASARPGAVAVVQGGEGGAGGDGLGPGTGGAGGAPEGQAGTDGAVCAVTPTHTPAPTSTPASTATRAPTPTPVPPTATVPAEPPATPTLPAPTKPGATVTAAPFPTETSAPTATASLLAEPSPTSTPSAPDEGEKSGPVGVFYLAYYGAGRTSLDDQRVRRALTQLVDRAVCVRLATLPGARMADGLVPPSLYPEPAARAAAGQLGLPYDPAAASETAAEVQRTPGLTGWPNEITLAAPRSEQAVAEAIAAAWEAGGVRVQREYFDLQPGEPVETTRYRDWLRRQRPHAYLRAWRADRAFDVFLVDLLEDTPLRWSPDEARVHLQAIEVAAGQAGAGETGSRAVLSAEQALVEVSVLYVPLLFYDLPPE